MDDEPITDETVDEHAACLDLIESLARIISDPVALAHRRAQIKAALDKLTPAEMHRRLVKICDAAGFDPPDPPVPDCSEM